MASVYFKRGAAVSVFMMDSFQWPYFGTGYLYMYMKRDNVIILNVLHGKFSMFTMEIAPCGQITFAVK